MRVHIEPDLQPAPHLLEHLVRAGFGDIVDDDVEVRLRPAAPSLHRWMQLCHHRQGCGRPTNYECPDGAGHCASSQRAVAKLAGDQAAHHPARQIDVTARYPYTGRVRDRRRHGSATGPRFLVSLQLPADPIALDEPYPRLSRDPRPAEAPLLRLDGWTEELVRLAAHEACHVDQHRRGVPRSELDAERRAIAGLEAHRRRPSLPLVTTTPPETAPIRVAKATEGAAR